MAVFKQGILGGFVGKVGTVVGYVWKGRNVMRSLAQHPRNPCTELQLAQRMRFTLVSRLVAACRGAINVGFANSAKDISAGNAAISANLDNGSIVGEGIDLHFQFDKIVLSAGSHILPDAVSAAPVADSHSIRVSWSDNSGVSPEVLTADRVVVCLYNPSCMASAYDTATATRGDEGLTITYPTLWVGDQAHLYLFATSPDGLLVTPTLYIAPFTLD